MKLFTDSVKLVVDDQGLALSKMEYLPYGETWFEEGDANNAPKYNSQELDKETGYYFYNARHYDPEISRFVTADNVIDGELDTQGWNRYMYVHGNPIQYRDPTGHETWAEKFSNAGEPAEAIGTLIDNFSIKDFGKGLLNSAKSTIKSVVHPGLPYKAIGSAKALVKEGSELKNKGIGKYVTEKSAQISKAFTQYLEESYKNDQVSGILGETTGYILSGFALDKGLGSLAKISQTKSFYTVQNKTDAARLLKGGDPWPTSNTRAALGEGVYSWGNKKDAINYFNRIKDNVPDAKILKFNISNKELSQLKSLNVDSLANPEGWMKNYSRLWGGTPNHGLEYIQRGTAIGTEHFFDKSVFNKLNFK